MWAPLSSGPVTLLSEYRPPWKEFAFSLGTQGLAVFLLVWLAVFRPDVLVPPARDYHFIRLVDTPPPISLEPAPRILPLPSIAPPPTDHQGRLRVTMERPKAKPAVDSAPKVELAVREPVRVAPPAPLIPRQPVRTNVFSSGSSATPTTARNPQQVQTGGFGDPNGVPAQPRNGRPVTIGQAGSFNLPSGPGYGNGSGGGRGARGVVASAGFGSGIAIGEVVPAVSRGSIRQSGFGDAKPVQSRPKPVESAVSKILPAEILSKPAPSYTEEAKALRIEGEVQLEVVFEASGQIRVLRVLRGLGHGLDENAIHAAEQIRFKPALRDGRPEDSTAVLHVIFQLASS
jgi:TonB family protein